MPRCCNDQKVQCAGNLSFIYSKVKLLTVYCNVVFSLLDRYNDIGEDSGKDGFYV